MNTIENLLKRFPVILQLLRFVAIGLINTALDFAVLNFVSKTLGVTEGFKLGGVNTIGFTLAVIQSYFWNKYWAFSQTQEKLIVNFKRLVLVGMLGAIVMVAVVGGAKFQVGNLFYLFTLVLLVIGELGIWFTQGISRGAQSAGGGVQFASFIFVSLIGLIINSVLVGYLSGSIAAIVGVSLNPELAKNVAKIVATLGSLIWNFIGYKLIVFKK